MSTCGIAINSFKLFCKIVFKTCMKIVPYIPHLIIRLQSEKLEYVPSGCIEPYHGGIVTLLKEDRGNPSRHWITPPNPLN
jgi:hypothetical protein